MQQMRDTFTNTYLITLLYLDTLSSNMTSCVECTTISSELDIKGSQVHYNKLIQLYITHIQGKNMKDMEITLLINLKTAVNDSIALTYQKFEGQGKRKSYM